MRGCHSSRMWCNQSWSYHLLDPRLANLIEELFHIIYELQRRMKPGGKHSYQLFRTDTKRELRKYASTNAFWFPWRPLLRRKLEQHFIFCISANSMPYFLQTTRLCSWMYLIHDMTPRAVTQYHSMHTAKVIACDWVMAKSDDALLRQLCSLNATTWL